MARTLDQTIPRGRVRSPRHAVPRHITPATPEMVAYSPPRAPAPPGPPPRVYRRPNRRKRLLRTAMVLAAVLLLIVAGTYGYLRYRLGQIKTVNCASCAVVASGLPFNVLVIGDDSRADNTPGENNAFGTTAQAGGAHSDTIKIAHIDPGTGTASLLSIPRDTYVQLSGLSTRWLDALGTKDQKINAALNDSVDSLVQTVQNSFGIPIESWALINFNGLIDAVRTVGGIRLDFPYPVRDDDDGNNNSGLSITTTGCQTLNGDQTLALSRSRFYQYEVRPGVWEADGSGDLGRIERQNVIIEALLDKAKSTYNPLTLNAFLGSIVHDVKLGGLSAAALLTLAVKYHGFAGSSLRTVTIPTYGSGSAAGSVQVVQEPEAAQLIHQFLGTSPRTVVTPPLDGESVPLTVPSATAGPTSAAPSVGKAVAGPHRATETAASTESPIPPYDPRPC